MNVRNVVAWRALASGLLLIALSFCGALPAEAAPGPGVSTCPPTVFVTPNGACCFDVTVRDEDYGLPVANSTVAVDFGACAVTFCPTQSHTGNVVYGSTDDMGHIQFCICGTFTPACTATISADAVVLCTVPVSGSCEADHYKMYVAPPVPVNIPVLLQDQWGQYPHQVDHLAYWMNPVYKTVFDPPPAQTSPVTHPQLHYAWWQINPQFNEKLVAATNQFGDQTLYVKDAMFLLTPALKNESGSPPQFNHYKCYVCEGPPVNREVKLQDQFDGPGGSAGPVTVTYPRWFCNPTMKQVQPPGGPTYPIYDNALHYVCYEYTPPDPVTHLITFTDQFIPGAQINVGPSEWLCVPTIKNGFTENKRSSWGKLKTLYR